MLDPHERTRLVYDGAWSVDGTFNDSGDKLTFPDDCR